MTTLFAALPAPRPAFTLSTSLVCIAFLAWTGFCLASSPEKSLVTLEIQYEVPAAGAVELVWGINGWQPVKEEIRPQGTKLRKAMGNLVMSTPMVRLNDVFVATIQTEAGADVDYQFLVTKTAGAAPIDVWEKDGSYRLTIKESQVLHVKSKRLHTFYGLLADKAGMWFLILLGVLFAGGAVACAFFLKGPETAPADDSRQYPIDTRFAVGLSLLAGSLGLLVITNHELWRDEWQAWRIVTSSRTLAELLSNSKYEGHPAIWYLSLYLVSKLSDSPFAMQLLHVLIGTSATFVFCRYAPFSRWQKTFLCFGYFLFFEYFIVSRNYAFGVLTLWVFCALRLHAPRRILACAVTLGLLANTSAFGAIIALSFGAWLLMETFTSGRKTSMLKRAGFASILALSVVLASVQSAPPPDNSPRMLTWNTSLLGTSLEKTFASIWKSYVPIPADLPHFWNTNLLDQFSRFNAGNVILESRDIQAMLALSLIGMSALALLRTPAVMVAYIFTTGMLLFFLHAKVNHGIRHTGHLFLVLVACLWLSYGATAYRTRFPTITFTSIYTAVLFAIQPVAGLVCAATDLVYPFSASQAAAKFIKDQRLANTLMVGSRFDIASAVACYLNRPIYFAENGQTGIFTSWGKPRSKLSPTEVIEIASSIQEDTHEDVLLILSYDPGESAAGLQRLGSFERGVLNEERYWLYLLPKTSDKVTS